MSHPKPTRGTLWSASMRGHGVFADHLQEQAIPTEPPRNTIRAAPELLPIRCAEVKGQAQFLLYLADQIEESLDQLFGQNPRTATAAAPLRGSWCLLGPAREQAPRSGRQDRRDCQELYVTVREYPRGGLE